MPKKPVIVIGGGMSGLGAAVTLLEEGYSCTLLESNPMPGGLAASFEIQGKHFPLGYHHILHEDKPLLALLKKLDLLKRVVWKKGKVLFALDNKIYNLADPRDFLKFPLPLKDKVRFIKLMAFCTLKNDWGKDLGDAETWLDGLAGENVRKTIFDPLMDIKYGLPSRLLSANWLGSRLHHQEFSKPLGFIPGTDWTKILIEALAQRVRTLGGEIVTSAAVGRITVEDGKISGLSYIAADGGKNLRGEIVVSTVPPHILNTLLPRPDEALAPFTYLDALSLILETKQRLPRELYLLSCLRPRYAFGGIFVLSSLNRTLGTEDGTVLNFFTTLSKDYEHLRAKEAEALLEIYQRDFEKLFGFRLEPLWHHLTLIKNYSPRFLKGYKNLSQRGGYPGLYLAGNYLTYPIITSTGSAYASGVRAARLIVADHE